MNKRNILLLLTSFVFICCNNNRMIVLIQKPTDKELDNLKINLVLDGKEIYKGVLEYTNVASSHYKILAKPHEGKHELKVILDEQNFNFDIYYPKDKFIILSPNYSKNNKENYIGIFKSDKQIDLQ